MKRLIELIREQEKRNRFLQRNQRMLIKVAAVALTVAVAFFVFFSGRGQREAPALEAPETGTEETAEAAGTELYVDIGGEVQNPAVVKLQEGSRVEDAIEAAGGLTEDADLTSINRAAFLQDGEKIYIPPIAEGSDFTPNDTTASQGYDFDGKININTADAQQLQELTGVGPATAEKIIQYREQNGRFLSVEDIKNVSGIGDKTYEKLKDQIKV